MRCMYVKGYLSIESRTVVSFSSLLFVPESFLLVQQVFARDDCDSIVIANAFAFQATAVDGIEIEFQLYAKELVQLHNIKLFKMKCSLTMLQSAKSVNWKLDILNSIFVPNEKQKVERNYFNIFSIKNLITIFPRRDETSI